MQNRVCPQDGDTELKKKKKKSSRESHWQTFSCLIPCSTVCEESYRYCSQVACIYRALCNTDHLKAAYKVTQDSINCPSLIHHQTSITAVKELCCYGKQ